MRKRSKEKEMPKVQRKLEIVALCGQFEISITIRKEMLGLLMPIQTLFTV